MILISPTNLKDYFISAPPQTIITYLASLNAFYIIAPEGVLISLAVERSAEPYDSRFRGPHKARGCVGRAEAQVASMLTRLAFHATLLPNASASCWIMLSKLLFNSSHCRS